jgi:hypothetical protein
VAQSGRFGIGLTDSIVLRSRRNAPPRNKCAVTLRAAHIPANSIISFFFRKSKNSAKVFPCCSIKPLPGPRGARAPRAPWELKSLENDILDLDLL